MVVQTSSAGLGLHTPALLQVIMTGITGKSPSAHCKVTVSPSDVPVVDIILTLGGNNGHSQQPRKFNYNHKTITVTIIPSLGGGVEHILCAGSGTHEPLLAHADTPSLCGSSPGSQLKLMLAPSVVSEKGLKMTPATIEGSEQFTIDIIMHTLVLIINESNQPDLN